MPGLTRPDLKLKVIVHFAMGDLVHFSWHTRAAMRGAVAVAVDEFTAYGTWPNRQVLVRREVPQPLVTWSELDCHWLGGLFGCSVFNVRTLAFELPQLTLPWMLCYAGFWCIIASLHHRMHAFIQLPVCHCDFFLCLPTYLRYLQGVWLCVSSECLSPLHQWRFLLGSEWESSSHWASTNHLPLIIVLLRLL